MRELLKRAAPLAAMLLVATLLILQPAAVVAQEDDASIQQENCKITSGPGLDNPVNRDREERFYVTQSDPIRIVCDYEVRGQDAPVRVSSELTRSPDEQPASLHWTAQARLYDSESERDTLEEGSLNTGYDSADQGELVVHKQQFLRVWINGHAPRSLQKREYRDGDGNITIREVTPPQSFTGLQVTLGSGGAEADDRIEMHAATTNWLQARQSLLEATERHGAASSATISQAEEWLKNGYPDMVKDVVVALDEDAKGGGGGNDSRQYLLYGLIALGVLIVIGVVIVIVVILRNRIDADEETASGSAATRRPPDNRNPGNQPPTPSRRRR